MKCDRRWWLDGRSALVDREPFPTQPGGQFCVPQKLYVAEIDLAPPHTMTVWREDDGTTHARVLPTRSKS